MHKYLHAHCIFTFFYVKVLCLGKIFEMAILLDLHSLRFSEFENRIFRCWSDNCLSDVWKTYAVRVFVRLLWSKLKNKLKNFKFGILHLCHLQILHDTFHKDRTKTLCTRIHKRILMHYGLWTKLVHFRIFILY